MDPIVGRPLRRKEDRRFLTGTGRYVDDISLPGQAFAAFVRSPHAHARIARVDTADAAASAGVVAVLTAREYAADGLGPVVHYANGVDHLDISKPAVPLDGFLFDPLPQQFPLADGRVRHVGEIVAMAIADSAAAAQDAAERVVVDYDPLPAVADVRDAVVPDAPQVWDRDNLCVVADCGDADATAAAFARAAHVIRLSAHNQRISAIPMETRAAIGEYDAATGIYTLHAPSQGVHRHKLALTAVFGVPDDRVRVVTPDVGGGFGQRTPCYPEYALVVWAAQRCGRPVKWTSSRSESFLSDYQARDVFSEGELALDGDGRFLAVRGTHLANLGAYPVTFSVVANVLRMAGGPYVIPAMHVVVKAAFSNTIPISVYRGAGRPEVTHLLERMIDLASRKTGIDRAALRRRNLIPDAALPYLTPLGHTYDSGAFTENMDIALDRIDWDGFPARRQAAESRGARAGIGIVTYLESPTGAPMERADVSVLPDGHVEAVVGTQASGQGHETSFAQVVATALEIPIDNVEIVFGDSARVLAGGGTHSDRSMRLGGTVLVRAAAEIVAEARNRAADLLEAAPADLVYADGRFAIAGTDRSVGLFELAATAPLAATNTFVGRLHANPNGVAACEVEVDAETGAVRIVRYVTVDDVGTVVNPMIVDGQVHGGIAQGAGQALGEHCVYDRATGQYLAASFMDYGIPRADDFPDLDVTINSLAAPSNPLGVKGAGECGTTPATAVLAAAIVDALSASGVTHIEMPFTPERLWRAARGD